MGMAAGHNSFLPDRIPSQMIPNASFPDSHDQANLAGYTVLSGESVENSPPDCRVINQAGLFQSPVREAEISSNPFASLLDTSSENLHHLALSSCSIFPGNILRNYYHHDDVTNITTRKEFQSYQSLGINMDSNGWMSANGTIINMDYPYGSSPKFTNELSLSLASSCQPSVISGPVDRAQCSEISSSGFCVEQSSSKDLSISFGSGRSSQLPSQLILGSRYLHGIQEILSQVASFSLESFNSYSTNMTQMPTNVSCSSSYGSDIERGSSFCRSEDVLDEDGRSRDRVQSALQRRALEAKKIQLLTLLEGVDDQYSQCLDEIHTVVSAFHAATELDPQIHTRSALQTVSFLYKNLRERISNQILALGGHFNISKFARENESSPETSFIQKQWDLQQLKRKDQLWRPQRGLPERSVSYLRAWMFQNFLHPYPKDSEKHLLAMKSGLTRSQVSNWFINARVRLWKPMIEEMYAEMNRRNAKQNEEENNDNRRKFMDINHQRFNGNESSEQMGVSIQHH
ncbi:hypothetical protein ACFE04_017443 [Oxalis oulophora]